MKTIIKNQKNELKRTKQKLNEIEEKYTKLQLKYMMHFMDISDLKKNLIKEL